MSTLPSASSCVLTCFLKAAKETGCVITRRPCICTNTAFRAAVEDCITGCSVDNQDAAHAIQAEQCASLASLGPASTSRSSSSAVPISTTGSQTDAQTTSLQPFSSQGVSQIPTASGSLRQVNTAAIFGVVIGASVFLAIVAASVLLLLRRQRRTSKGIHANFNAAMNYVSNSHHQNSVQVPETQSIALTEESSSAAPSVVQLDGEESLYTSHFNDPAPTSTANISRSRLPAISDSPSQLASASRVATTPCIPSGGIPSSPTDHTLGEEPDLAVLLSEISRALLNERDRTALMGSLVNSRNPAL